MPKVLTDFKSFLFRGNVIDLAVAVVIGNAFNAVVQSLVKDIITPFAASIGGVTDFSSMSFTVNNATIKVGDFLNAVSSFVLIGAVVYFLIVLPKERFAKKEIEMEKALQEKPSPKKAK